MRSLLGWAAVVVVFVGVVVVGGTTMDVWDAVEIPAYGDANVGVTHRVTRNTSRAKHRLAAAKPERAERRASRRHERLVWARSANAVCRREKAAFAALDKPSSPAEVDSFLARAIEINRRMNSELASLSRPRSTRPPVATLVRLQGREERLLDDFAAAYRRHDAIHLFGLADALVDVAYEEDAILRRLGASACALESPTIGLARAY